MKVEFNEETSVRKSLSFEIEPEVVDKEIANRAREYAKKARIPGFRPGKVPASVIKQRFRDQIHQDVAEILVNRVVFEEIEGRGLRPLAAPRVADLKIHESEPMTFRAVFETLPLIELPEYKGLDATARAAAVSDDDVKAQIERLREEAARYDPIEGRPARTGDFVLVDVSWKDEGGGEAQRDENALIEVGSEDNHPDLSAALEGTSAGDARTVTIAYPEEHPRKSLAGRTVHYDLAVKGVKEKVLPELDDEFAKDLGEFGSLEELTADLRKRLLAAEERKIDREVKEALVQALVDRTSFEVPEALIERHMNARTEGAARNLALQGIDPTRVGMDWTRYRESQREESLKAAKADILLDEIARREKLEILDAELDAELARLAERMKKSKEALRAQMEKEGDLVALKARMREEKTLDLLKANARLAFE